MHGMILPDGFAVFWKIKMHVVFLFIFLQLWAQGATVFFTLI